jgi:hypothetical protein
MKRLFVSILAICAIGCGVEAPPTAGRSAIDVQPERLEDQSNLVPCEGSEQCGTLSQCGFDSPPDTPLCAPHRYCCLLPPPEPSLPSFITSCSNGGDCASDGDCFNSLCGSAGGECTQRRCCACF